MAIGYAVRYGVWMEPTWMDHGEARGIARRTDSVRSRSNRLGAPAYEGYIRKRQTKGYSVSVTPSGLSAPAVLTFRLSSTNP